MLQAFDKYLLRGYAMTLKGFPKTKLCLFRIWKWSFILECWLSVTYSCVCIAKTFWFKILISSIVLGILKQGSLGLVFWVSLHYHLRQSNRTTGWAETSKTVLRNRLCLSLKYNEMAWELYRIWFNTRMAPNSSLLLFKNHKNAQQKKYVFTNVY